MLLGNSVKFFGQWRQDEKVGKKVDSGLLLQVLKDINSIQPHLSISGEFHEEVDFDERVRRLQNDFGVDVLFTWGIIEQEGKNRMALVAGGWNDALLVEEGDQS